MARNTFVVDVGDVLGMAGVRRHYRHSGPLSGIDLPAVHVPHQEDVEVDLVLEALGSTVVAEGSARAQWEGECRRCLEMTSGQVEVDFQEIYAPEAVEGETFPLVAEQIDLEPMLRELVTLALPLAPLCSEGCAGPDPDAHPVNPGDENGEEGFRSGRAGEDPWAALDQIRFGPD